MRSATHTFNGVAGGQEMDNIRFIANYFDTLGGTPSQAEVWFDGRTFPMTCDTPYGSHSQTRFLVDWF